MQRCDNCANARQVGDKKRQDVVGCTEQTLEPLKIKEFTKRHHYKGYFYGGRRVGNTEVSDCLGAGVLSLGIIVDADAWCSQWRKI